MAEKGDFKCVDLDSQSSICKTSIKIEVNRCFLGL